ncbi:MAG: TldD/PmbA family protein [Nitrososphaerota archaeon]
MEDILNYALRMASKMNVKYAEARYQANMYEESLLKNGVPEISSKSHSKGIGIRVIVNSAMGFSSTSTITKSKIEEAVKEAVGLAKSSLMLTKKGINLSEETMHSDKVIIKPRINPEYVASESRLELLKIIDDEMLGVAKKMNVKVSGRLLSVGYSVVEKMIMNTDGTNIYTKLPYEMATYSFVISANNRSLQRYENMGATGGWEIVERWLLDEKIREEAINISKAVLSAKSPPSDKIDVILGSEIVGIVCHESTGHPSEADRILGREAAQAGETYITPELIGKQIGSKAVTIVDNPVIPGSFGYYVYDDEGVKARERILVEEGRIKEFLHNRETAAEFGVKSNGAARASSYNREPMIRMSNTYMKPGDYSFEELIEDIKLGVYIKSYLEWNIDDKRWNQRYVGVESYLINNGRITDMLYQPAIELTTQGLYSSIDAIGKDLAFYAGYCGKGDPIQAVPVWFGGPPVRLRNVKLST